MRTSNEIDPGNGTGDFGLRIAKQSFFVRCGVGMHPPDGCDRGLRAHRRGQAGGTR